MKKITVEYKKLSKKSKDITQKYHSPTELHTENNDASIKENKKFETFEQTIISNKIHFKPPRSRTINTNNNSIEGTKRQGSASVINNNDYISLNDEIRNINNFKSIDSINYNYSPRKTENSI